MNGPLNLSDKQYLHFQCWLGDANRNPAVEVFDNDNPALELARLIEEALGQPKENQHE